MCNFPEANKKRKQKSMFHRKLKFPGVDSIGREVDSRFFVVPPTTSAMDNPHAPEQPSGHTAQTLLEHLLNSPFIDDISHLPLLLEETSKDAYAPLLMEVAKKISEDHGSRLRDGTSQVEKAQRRHRRALELEEECEEALYWSQSDGDSDAYHAASSAVDDATDDLERCRSAARTWIIKELENASLPLLSTRDELGQQAGGDQAQSLFKKEHHMVKGAIAETAILYLLRCFGATLSPQHSAPGCRADAVCFPATRTLSRVWNEVKCVEALDDRSVRQLETVLRGGEPVIVYHFVRLLQHQAKSFDQWRKSLLRKMTDACSKHKGIKSQVYAVFYKQPLLSIKEPDSEEIIHETLGRLVTFRGVQASKLLESGFAVTVNPPQDLPFTPIDDYTRHWHIVQRSPLLTTLASLDRQNALEMYTWLSRREHAPKWVQDRTVAPRDWESICDTIKLLTEYLDKPVILSRYGNYRSVLLWHGASLEWSECGGYCWWVGLPPAFADYERAITADIENFYVDLEEEKQHVMHLLVDGSGFILPAPSGDDALLANLRKMFSTSWE